ncbi:MaoC/PaaZ C-terminal domain-containing protein [Nocardia vinacea]|uniref:MaoC/PaaZ C-terminal domain-containing protein n=1 Tax=Nocardia vinacea TaxID=96468 RepID=A0ABZ1YWG5_9NOCA|nr:MaoC/PaaZ C-terminal domain-containing protein [Nocardia vinacea]
MSRLAVGEQLPLLEEGPLTRTDFVRYQGASGDMNAIHHDDELARSHGFPGVFAVGMRQAGVLASYLADTFGPDCIREFSVRFEEQAWPGDIITYQVTVATRYSTVDSTFFELDLLATRQSGSPHLTGNAKVCMAANK